MVPVHYYLDACIVFLAVMLLMLFLRADLRKKILLAAAFALPLGILGYYFSLSYWDVPKLLGLNPGIEDFLIVFSNAGIAAGIYEFALKKKLAKIEGYGKKGIYFAVVLLLVWFCSFFLMNKFFSFNVMHDGFVTIAAGLIVLYYFRKDLLLPSVYAGLLFLVFYFALFLLSFLFVPGIVHEGWLMGNLSGIVFLGIPLEEIGYAFLFGAAWSHLYEAVCGYKVSSRID